MSNTKSIEDMIRDEAEAEYQYDVLDGASYASAQLLRRQAYTAGRLKGIEREKELEECHDGLKADLERCKKISSEVFSAAHRLIKDLDRVSIGGLANQSLLDLKELLGLTTPPTKDKKQ